MSKYTLSFKIITSSKCLWNYLHICVTGFITLQAQGAVMADYLLPTWLNSIPSHPNLPCRCQWLWAQTVKWTWRMWRCRLFHVCFFMTRVLACLMCFTKLSLVVHQKTHQSRSHCYNSMASYAYREAIFLLSSPLLAVSLHLTPLLAMYTTYSCAGCTLIKGLLS